MTLFLITKFIRHSFSNFLLLFHFLDSPLGNDAYCRLIATVREECCKCDNNTYLENLEWSIMMRAVTLLLALIGQKHKSVIVVTSRDALNIFPTHNGTWCNVALNYSTNQAYIGYQTSHNYYG